MLAFATERKHHVSTRPEDLACEAGAAESRRKHWLLAQREAAAGPRLICGESLDAVSRDIGVLAHRLSEWRGRFLAGAQNALKARESSPQDDEIARLMAIVGKTTVENELLCEKIGRLEKGVPFHLRRSTK